MKNKLLNLVHGITTLAVFFLTYEGLSLVPFYKNISPDDILLLIAACIAKLIGSAYVAFAVWRTYKP